MSESSVEAWCEALVTARVLSDKITPPPVPDRFAPPGRGPLRLAAPGRPPELVVVPRAPKAPRAGALVDAKKTAELLHTFLHHELQAAELMAWAVLAFPDAPEPFRRGLLRIAEDELRHVRLFADEIRRLGHEVGEFVVRDWFWTRAASLETPAAFVAWMGVGLEGANLDHAARWSRLLAGAGQASAAAVVERIGDEEIPHVRFALRWLAQFRGDVGYASWLECLPPPRSPLLFRGRPLDRERRLRAGMDAAFLDALEREVPVLDGGGET